MLFISETEEEGITAVSINLLTKSDRDPEPFAKQSARHLYPEER